MTRLWSLRDLTVVLWIAPACAFIVSLRRFCAFSQHGDTSALRFQLRRLGPDVCFSLFLVLMMMNDDGEQKTMMRAVIIARTTAVWILLILANNRLDRLAPLTLIGHGNGPVYCFCIV